jgi:hypothetical protein
MKKLFFVFVLALGLMNFTSNNYIESNNSEFTEIVETRPCDYYTRTCYYQGGQLLGCTEWECNIILDEIIL